MEIVLGSKSKIKEEVVRNAVTALFPQTEFSVTQFDVEDAGAEPVGEDALFKQLNASIEVIKKEKPVADYYVVMEGGVLESVAGMEEIACVVVEDKNGRHSQSRSVSFPIPPLVAKKVREGMPFATVVDEIYSTQNIKNNQGFVGFLTNGLVDKKALYYQPTVVAFSKFIKESWFWNK